MSIRRRIVRVERHLRHLQPSVSFRDQLLLVRARGSTRQTLDAFPPAATTPRIDLLAAFTLALSRAIVAGPIRSNPAPGRSQTPHFG